MSERPYLQLGAKELLDLAQENADSFEELDRILFELSVRGSKIARYVEAIVQDLYLKSLLNIRVSWDAFLAERKLFRADAVDDVLPLDIFELIDEKIIGITGDDPYEEDLLRSLVFWQGGINSEDYLWADGQIVVIGRESFNREYLHRTIKMIVVEELDISFMSQEAFLDLILYGEAPGYFSGDPRVSDHPGLAYLSSVGFQWPSTYAEPRQPIGGSNEYDFQDHPLKSVFGYTVRKGTPVAYRHGCLTAAVTMPPPRGLGLEEVVHHISNLVRWRKQTQLERSRDAIRRWEEDLAWLYETYYTRSIHAFLWPEY